MYDARIYIADEIDRFDTERVLSNHGYRFDWDSGDRLMVNYDSLLEIESLLIKECITYSII